VRVVAVMRDERPVAAEDQTAYPACSSKG